MQIWKNLYTLFHGNVKTYFRNDVLYNASSRVEDKKLLI